MNGQDLLTDNQIRLPDGDKYLIIRSIVTRIIPSIIMEEQVNIANTRFVLTFDTVSMRLIY